MPAGRMPVAGCSYSGVVRSADTTPAARAVQISVYRRLSPSQRVSLALSMSEDVRAIARAGADSRPAAPEGGAIGRP